MVRRSVLTVAVAIVVTGCSASGPSTAAAPSLPADLAFSGLLNGAMTTADSALRPGTQNPTSSLSSLAPHTQCSYFDSGAGRDFVASLTGVVNGTRVRLAVEVNADQPTYTSPGTVLAPGTTNSGGGAQLQLPQDGTPRYGVLGPKGEAPARIVLGSDRHSGTIDAWFAEPGSSQKQAQPDVHVSGMWRCA